MLLRAAAIVAALLAGFGGLLAHASPRPSDQIGGKLIMAAAAAVIALALFVDRPWVKPILIAAVVVTFLFAAYMVLAGTGRI